MPRLLIIAQESGTLAGLDTSLARHGFTCSVSPPDNGVVKKITAELPDLLLVATDGQRVNTRTRELTQSIKQESPLPVIALVARDKLNGINNELDVDDFIISPYDVKELVLRVNRLIRRNGHQKSSELIKCDSLVIDLARCEVTIDGRVVELTFREYELLKFLAGNRGHVYTRQALLDRVWGYDYYGGDRTVDVHVRRLRSKIEDSKHTFIETVRNIGYRFTSGNS